MPPRCLHGPPCVAIFVGRWGEWPVHTPLLLASYAANQWADFLILSDAHPCPTAQLPRNVHFLGWTLPELEDRMRMWVGLRIGSLGVTSRYVNASQGRWGAGIFSSAKTNDLKPMWGEAFEDLLDDYAWWGYAQEDLLLGNVSRFITRQVLANADVISPLGKAASGPFTLLRNTRTVTRAWRFSKDAHTVLTEPQYYGFDEWWGKSRHHFVAILEEMSAARMLRLRRGGYRWFEDDLGEDSLGRRAVVCWRKGALYVSTQFAPALQQIPCFAASDDEVESRKVREVCMHHLVLTKAAPALRSLARDASLTQALLGANEFALTPDGVILPQRDLESHGLARFASQAPRRSGGTKLFVFFGLGQPVTDLRRMHIERYSATWIDSCRDDANSPAWMRRHGKRYCQRAVQTKEDCAEPEVKTQPSGSTPNKSQQAAELRKLCSQTCGLCKAFGSLDSWESYWSAMMLAERF